MEAAPEWERGGVTLNSVVLGGIKVTAAVIHPSRPRPAEQLKGNGCRPSFGARGGGRAAVFV